jgi:hypothetical protein
MIVMQNAPIDSAEDEVVFSAKYSIGNVSAILVTWCLSVCLFVYLWHGATHDIAYDIYDGIVVGELDPIYLLALGSIMLILLLPFLLLALNPLCFKEIIFYPNRVETVRRIFRGKTIYYSNGMVERGTLLPGYLIEELPEKGQLKSIPFLYAFELFFFPSEAGREIETILDYLTDDLSKKKLRPFKRFILPGLVAKP